jgi:hypothetical protein
MYLQIEPFLAKHIKADPLKSNNSNRQNKDSTPPKRQSPGKHVYKGVKNTYKNIQEVGKYPASDILKIILLIK